MHWHGMELDSYYDGVHGWSGAGARVTPIIKPGATFVVRFTPPRTGTFIYHTHLHDHRQLPAGLYGALLVVDPGIETSFDPATDHVFVIGGGGFVLGSDAARSDRCSMASPIRSFVWKAGTQASRAADQHHDRRHLHGDAANERWPGDVAAADEGWRAAPARSLRAGPGPADDCRRGDLRLRVPGAAWASEPLARGQDDGRQVAGAGARDHVSAGALDRRSHAHPQASARFSPPASPDRR